MTTLHTLDDGPADADCQLLLAHGAGAPMDSAFLEAFVTLMTPRGIATTRFEFEYMAARRDGGKKKPPPKAERLVQEYASAVDIVRARIRKGQRLFIGGKSMGGRVASLIADELHTKGLIAGLICLGYPFHPPTKPEHLRTAHLLAMQCPALIVQGDRDPFGPRTEVETMALPASIRVHWAADGDHDLGPRGASGFTRRGNLEAAADAVAAFARQA
ncbi:MAG: alpha/beta family hydrolase [Hyphomicrobiaceae bacterium]